MRLVPPPALRATSPNVASLLGEETRATFFLPPKGGVPPKAGRGELLGPLKGGIRSPNNRGLPTMKLTFLPLKGGVPPEAGRGESVPRTTEVYPQ
jgi:hypothetical protein